jgi:glutamyl-tRNA reductase
MKEPRRPPEALPLALVGCDFRVASAAWRAGLVLDADDRKSLHRALHEAAGASGLAVLATCNRTEWIAQCDDPRWAAELLRAWMLRRWRDRFGAAALPCPYVHVGAEAARHFIGVAVGLDSFVPGEREIAGQCNRALLEARHEGTSGPLLQALGQGAARTVRRVERLCRFRDAGRGVHQLVRDLLAERLPRLGRPARVGVWGMGEIGRKVAALLRSRALAVTCFNRTIPDEHRGAWLPLADLAAVLPELDALVVATGAQQPLLLARDLASSGREAPLLVVDLGNLPQVAPADETAGVELAGLDDLLAQRTVAVQDSERQVAHEAVELGVDELALAWRKRAAAQWLRVAQESRSRLAAERLPELLDAHAGDLPPDRRRKLEVALRSLLKDQQRDMVAHADVAARGAEAEA